jgi:hypothetical protein
MANLLAAQPRFRRRRGPNRSTLHGFAHVRLERASIVAWCSEPGKGADTPHQPKSGGIDSGAYPGVTALEPDQRGYGYAQALGPGTLGLAPANPGNGEIFAQRAQRLGSRRRHHLEGLGTLWHNKEFINQGDLVKSILPNQKRRRSRVPLL